MRTAKNLEIKQRWQTLSYPIRPLLEEFEGFIDYESQILILGCTPEFRDEFSNFNANVVCFDINESNYKSLSQKANLNERFLKGNWLEFNVELENKFGFVISDGLLLYVPFQKLESLFSNISKYIYSQGSFVFRGVFHSEFNFISFIESFSCESINASKSLISFFLMALLVSSTNANGSIELYKVRKNISYAQKNLSKPQLDLLNFHFAEYLEDKSSFFELQTIPQTIFSVQYTVQMLNNYFSIVNSRKVTVSYKNYSLNYIIFRCYL